MEVAGVRRGVTGAVRRGGEARRLVGCFECSDEVSEFEEGGGGDVAAKMSENARVFFGALRATSAGSD